MKKPLISEAVQIKNHSDKNSLTGCVKYSARFVVVAVMAMVFGLAGFVVNAQAAILAQYTFPTIQATPAGNINPTTTGAGMTLSPITNGATNVYEVSSNGYASDPELRVGPQSTTLTGAVGANSYVQFTLTPNGGNELNLTNLTLNAARGGGATPRGWGLRSSLDGYTANISGPNDIPTQRPAWTGYNADLSGAGYQGVTIPITFRIYFYSPATGSTVEMDDIIVNGTVTSVDTTAPTAGGVSVTPDSGSKVPAAFTITTPFTDAESAVSSCEYTLNGSIWNTGVVSGTGPYICTANVTGQNDGANLNINMRGTSGGGGPMPASAISRTVDAVKPTVNIAIAGSTSGSPVNFAVSFTEAVTGFLASDVVLGGTAGATTPVVTGSGTLYNVAVSGMTGDGTITMDIAADAAFDVVGNGNTAASQATTSWTNCSLKITSLLIFAAPNPINGPTPGTATVTLNPGGDTVTSAQWSSDGGTSWNNSGTTYTAPSQANSSVNIIGQATEGTCSSVFAATNQPYALPYDTRTPYIVAENTAGAIQQGTTNVTVTMPYLGNDSDSSARFTVNYTKNGVPQTAVGPIADVPAGTPFETTLGPFAEGDVIVVNVVYDDATAWTAAGYTELNADQGPFTVNILTWADNPLLHNSNRFACSVTGFFADEAACIAGGGTWSYDRKHTVTGNGAEWGTSNTGDVYGPILCSTCHRKNSGNIKRITSSVTASTGTFPGSTVVATEANPTANSSDYGDDSVAHNPSDKICEVCHSKNLYHNSDRALNATNLGNNLHQNKSDCISCHNHTGGFRASCAACHGNPPETGKMVTTNPTLSTIPGAHLAHVNTQSIGCELCHYNSVGGGVTHDSGAATGQISLGFVGLPNPANLAAQKSTGGTYSGQTTPAVLYDTTDVGTSIVGGNNRTCANYCHGSTIGGISPAWDAASPTMCGTCHGDDAASASTLPSGTSHNTHANTMGLACIDCHGTNGTGPSGHLDGAVTWDVTTLPNTGTTATYSGSTTGTTGAVAPSTGSYGTCSNISCHFGNVTPAWDNGPLQCNDCHNNGAPDDTDATTQLQTAAPNSGQHQLHVTASDSLIKNFCVSCHGAGADTGTHTGHADTFPTFPATGTATDPMQASDYSDGTPSTPGNALANDDTCATACHLAANWGTAGDLGTGSGIAWTVETGNCDGVAVGAPVVNYCLDCHSTTYGDLAGPAVVFGNHTNAKTADETMSCKAEEKNQCLECHVLHDDAVTPDPLAVWIPNPSTQSLRTSLGLDYKGANHHNAVNLRKAAGGKTSRDTEAEICWECHDSTINGTKQSEWGVNTGTGSTYDYGNLTGGASNWIGAEWNSPVAIFSYKKGTIESTHSVNSAATVPGLDAVAQIRCSYCHDVHDTMSGSPTGTPYLRGTWKGNPYREDGAPETNVAYTNGDRYGTIPRGGTQYTALGGYQIDQNNGSPTATWTLADSAGLCTTCHGNNVDSMNEFDVNEAGAAETAAQSWVGTNGHSAAVIGGTNSVAANIFTNSDRGSANPGTGDPDVTNGPMAYQKSNGATGSGYGPGDTDGAPFTRGTRMGSSGGDAGSPGLQPYAKGTNGSEQEHRGYFNWGVTVDNATTDTDYHNFSCSKCHNPHASRLPRLMITNCLDTSHNTWDDNNGNPSNVSGSNAGTQLSDATTSQNCHRRATVGGMGSGWNNVTPW